MKLRADQPGRALVQHLAEERVPERIGQLWRIASFLGMRGGQPELLACELLAGLANPRKVALEYI